ncbi:sulfur carrier protein ThiS [Bifidobacterium sp.]|jgi:thiamine biosynthesis protein ThiS|uniref:sulfur carrier protein ThiS n=1 Tax=Bifidobacterium sp. TaxID=41200 RepID=UPI0025C30052|nr:sulfur carrier protein ThiS [Bifidobacterium sp.]MCI1635154.1 sulfur carrier protein ThiS [Bifidobacterium sp.]
MGSNTREALRLVCLTCSKSEAYRLNEWQVEVNGGIIPLRKHAETMLSDDDTVEIVTFVQGG